MLPWAVPATGNPTPGFSTPPALASGKAKLSPAEVELFNTRLAELVPDEKARTWLVAGDC